MTASMESRVVPATSLTIARLEPKIVLRREDFPTLGRPTIAMLISSCGCVRIDLYRLGGGEGGGR